MASFPIEIEENSLSPKTKNPPNPVKEGGGVYFVDLHHYRFWSSFTGFLRPQQIWFEGTEGFSCITYRTVQRKRPPLQLSWIPVIKWRPWRGRALFRMAPSPKVPVHSVDDQSSTQSQRLTVNPWGPSSSGSMRHPDRYYAHTFSANFFVGLIFFPAKR